MAEAILSMMPMLSTKISYNRAAIIQTAEQFSTQTYPVMVAYYSTPG